MNYSDFHIGLFDFSGIRCSGRKRMLPFGRSYSVQDLQCKKNSETHYRLVEYSTPPRYLCLY